ncbi:MAG: orotate phosphoribosyltransferase [Muribaculaceae bacterium]|nr:orotate phosphoribosyltransferase [Muribaculaceae bacterium]
MKKLDTLLAEKLMQISAIKLQPDSPFSWATGWNSPIYTDLRMALSSPEVRNLIKVEMARLIMENFGDAQVIAAIATGAIAHGALVADSLALPMVYVRSKPKDHGLENLIEGDIKPGQKVVLIEDQLSTGNNCMKCLNTVRDAGGEVLGAIVIFDYQFSSAAKALKRAKLPIITLTNFETMIDVAMDSGQITQADADTLQQWHTDPENWAPAGFDAVD